MGTGCVPARPNRSVSTSEDQIVDEPGSHTSVHVSVVDEDGDPVTGQDVSARFSSALGSGPVHHQYTDVKGHAAFSREHPNEPLHVTFEDDPGVVEGRW